MIKRTTTLCALVALGMITALPASAQLPKKDPPKGMLEISTGTTGRILTSRMGGTSSAHKMLLALKMVSREYFDGPISVTRAYADPMDQNLQAAFTAKLKGTPVRGIVAVAMNGSDGQGTLLFDNAKTFETAFKTLVAKQQSGGGGNAGRPAPVRLIPTAAPDGSCQISLPPGFTITGAYKGTLDISGPNGAVMALGAPIAITNRAYGQSDGMPAVDFNNPVRAAVDYMTYASRKANVPISLKIIDSTPTTSTGGRAAYIRYSAQVNGQTMEGFGLFSINPTDANLGFLYMSFIAAPHSSYRTQFPAMLEAWKTWSINPKVFQERLMAAANSLKGMSDIISGSNANTQATNARVSEAWSDVMRGQTTWDNKDNGNRYKISNTYTDGGGIPMENGTVLQQVPLQDL